MKQKLCLILFILIILVSTASAHETEETHDETPYVKISESPWNSLGLVDPVLVLIIAFAISLIGVFVSVYTISHAGEKTKKLLFLLIAVPIIIATIYLSASTVYLNLVSATQGPIHWHADYEV